MRTSDVQVDFRDRDEALFRRTGRVAHPVVSSVLFLNRCRGGLLAVVDAPPNDANWACAPDALDADLVKPWPNRFAVFAGDATHGVLDANNDVRVAGCHADAAAPRAGHELVEAPAGARAAVRGLEAIRDAADRQLRAMVAPPRRCERLRLR